jgi:hypothetical protein
MNTLIDTMNTLTVSASTDPPRLTSLPQELRYRIYVFAFDASFFTLTQREHIRNEVYASTAHFPIALSATCQLLNIEVKHYLSTLWEGLLVLDTGRSWTRLPRYIPRAYLGRVQTLVTSSDVAIYNQIDLDILSNLSFVVLALPNLSVPFARAEADTLFDPDKTKDKMNEDLLHYLSETFRLWNKYQAIHAVVKRWIAEETQVRMRFRICLGHQGMVHAVVDVEIDCLPGDVGWTTLKPHWLAQSVPLSMVPGYSVQRTPGMRT